MFFLSGYPTGKAGDRGDRTEFHVVKFYVSFLLPVFGHLTSQKLVTFNDIFLLTWFGEV